MERPQNNIVQQVLDKALVHYKNYSNIAKQLNVSVATISRWYGGKCFPSVELFLRLDALVRRYSNNISREQFIAKQLSQHRLFCLERDNKTNLSD